MIDLDDEPVHGWFELSYAQYLTIPRSVLQSMPSEWQRRFVECLEQLDGSIDWRPEDAQYWVQLRDRHGRYVNDGLADYERGRRRVPLKARCPQRRAREGGVMGCFAHEEAETSCDSCATFLIIERDALRAEVEALKGVLAAHGKGQEAIVDDNVSLRADLDAARTEVERLKQEMSHNAVMLALKAAIEEAEQRRVDLDAARELAAAAARAQLRLVDDLDAARKLLERWRIWWCTQDVNTIESPRRDTDAFLAQKRGG